jgi:hypothetical protein
MWHVVRQGECLSSIAAGAGLFWRAVWEAAENGELRGKRKNPNVLYPGDRVWVPEKEEKLEAGATGQRHMFRVKGAPAKIRLRLLTPAPELEPRKDLSYLLIVDGTTFQGKTGADGMIEHSIKPDARQGLLTVYTETRTEQYQLKLGAVDPHDTQTGVGQRLMNLGFGPLSNPLPGQDVPVGDEAFRRAIELFQKRSRLPVTGHVDPATREKLEELHGL